jgi:hypothetical protein
MYALKITAETAHVTTAALTEDIVNRAALVFAEKKKVL